MTETASPTSPRLRLRVKNFLCLKDIDCEFRGVNILIGPQAEGKSLVAKLVYFFFNHCLDLTLTTFGGKNKDDAEQASINFFSQLFYEQTWQNEKFKITFECSGYELAITNESGLKFFYNDAFEQVIHTLFALQRAHKVFKFETSDAAFLHYQEMLHFPFHLSLIAISDARIVVSALLAKNIFALLKNSSESLTIDRFLREYMAHFEFARNSFVRSPNGDNMDIARGVHVEDLIHKQIIKGVFRANNQGEYIFHENHIPLPLHKSSAGQQEALPVLLGLYRLKQETKKTVYVGIEEPEAHLFPTAQKAVMEEIVAAWNHREHKDIICCTTHSPYLLSTLNNCITAHEVLATKDAEKIARLEHILPREKWISFDDVRCYYLEGGKAENLMDEEYRVIDAAKIDTASEKLAADLAEMLDILE